MHWRDVIRRPIITEKSSRNADDHAQYTFAVDPRANKIQVAHAIEQAWPDVKVVKVRIANMPAKRGRRMRRVTVRKPAYKKALVTLGKGTIDLFEGV